MTMKFVEIRDKATFIPAVAFEIGRADGYLARRAGFDSPMIFLVTLATERCAYDPYHWTDRTHQTAHLWLSEHWDEFESGGVVDVEFILGERSTPKPSEREQVPV